ncbi:prepilin peptidase [Kiloniella sp.]|uniref:prepilin peptidase n=1 Tax=Kiloniella sp. TaxID=1938587 RepID=UPI003A91F6EB
MRPELLFLLIASPFIGSFLALVSQRLPLGQQVLTGRSHCPGCNRSLNLLDMVPLISALVLKFRCRSCGFAFGTRDSMIELLSLWLCLWAVLALPWPVVLVGVPLAWCLLVLAIIDFEHLYLPDLLLLPLTLAGLGFSYWWQPDLFVHHTIGLLMGGGLFFLIRWLYSRLRGREAMGLGDVKFACAIGAWVGWMGLASVILIAAVSALVFYLIRERLRKRSPRLIDKTGSPPEMQAEEELDTEASEERDSSLLPFGPFLALGLWIIWLHGPIMVG